MITRPTHAEILAACKTRLETLATAGEVIVDPLYSDDPVTYVALAENAPVDLWVVEMGGQQERERAEGGGTTGFAEIYFHGFVQVDPTRSGGGSLAYSATKWREAEALFELRANESLGFAANVLRQYFLHTPFGFPKEKLDLVTVHYAPYVMRYWTKGC